MKVSYNNYQNSSIMCRYRQKLYQIKNILEENEIEQIKNLNGNEWAYVFIYHDKKLIIPCKHILKQFYLKNKTMENALIEGNINHLFDNFSFISSNIIINNVKKCSSITSLFIARMIYDKRIENIFYYHFFQLITTKNKNLNLLRSFFPTFGKIHIIGNFTKITDEFKKELYILESFSNYTNLNGPFNDVLYFEYIKNQEIQKKFSDLTNINVDPNRIYYQSDETYFLGKSYFYEKYLSLDIYLANLGCKIKELSKPKYIYEYIKDFDNYEKSTIYNYTFCYIVFNFDSKNYLIIFFDNNELNDIWIIENFNDIVNIEEFLTNIFQYTYMSTLKININSFCEKYNLKFQSMNNYTISSNINTIIHENIDIKKIIEIALFNLNNEYNKQFIHYHQIIDKQKRTTRKMRREMKFRNEPVKFYI